MQRQPAFLLGRDHVIGMGHLQLFFVALDLAAHDAFGSGWQKPAQIVGVGMKEDQFERRRVVGAADLVGLPAVARRQMVEHIDGHGCDAAGLRLDQLRTVGTVDQPGGKIEDEVNEPGSHQPRNQLFQLGADAAKRANFGEKREQNRGPHEAKRIWCGPIVLNAVRGISAL